ncbi:hypothetical protein Hanom_Chr16g01470091 [Helianthus anomalus]
MDHPFLFFDQNNVWYHPSLTKCNELWNRRDQFGISRRLDWDAMTELNQRDQLANMLSPPFSRLVNIDRPIYLELTLKFFATYSYEKPKASRSPDFQHKKQINFRLGDNWHNWAVGRLGRRLGIYTDDEMNSEFFTDQYTFPSEEEQAAFWARVAVGPPYDPRVAKASRLRDPLLRVMHHIFSHTIARRLDSFGNCPTPDVIFLYAIAEGVHIILTARMAEYFVRSSGRTASSQIHGGQYVTQLAYAMGIMTDEVVKSLTLVTEGTYVDIRL